jgi:hypothetical protein
VDKYKDKYAVKPTVNRYAARWGFDSVLIDMSDTEARKLIDYYFTTISSVGHSLDWFFYNYEKLAVAMEAAEEDATALSRIREETRIRTEEWRRKRGLEH